AALTEASRGRAKSVTRLTLKLGGLDGVSAGTLRGAFRERGRGTLAAWPPGAGSGARARARRNVTGPELALSKVNRPDRSLRSSWRRLQDAEAAERLAGVREGPDRVRGEAGRLLRLQDEGGPSPVEGERVPRRQVRQELLGYSEP